MLSAGLLLAGLTTKAQMNTSTNPVRFGIRAGANLTTLGKLYDGSNYHDYDYKAGFTGGVYAILPLGGQFEFVPEVLFSQKGGKITRTAGSTTGKLESRVNYLDVPLTFAYRPSPAFSIFLGPQVAFLLSQKTTLSASGDDGSAETSNTDTDNMRKALAGGTVGLGYDINPNLNIKARYMMDFQGGMNDDQNQDKAKSSGFALTLGYTF